MATKEQKQQLIDTLKFTPRTYQIYIGGYGGEAYAGRVSRETYEYFKENKIDIEEYALDWDDKFSDVPRELMPFSSGSPYDCDSLFHSSGAELSNSNEITVSDEDGNTHWACALGIDELELEGVAVDEFGGAVLDEEIGDNEVAFWGGNGEKGTFFDGEILLRAPFDPKKLKIGYENCDGWYIINLIEYDGEEIDGTGGYSTTGKWTENKWILGDNVEGYEPVSREDTDEESSEESEWPTPHETGTNDPIDFPVMPEIPTTDWFPSDINPVRKGVYEVMIGPVAAWPFPNQAHYTWSGKTWKDVDGKKATIYQWRGLAFNPEEL